jgi:hypothetical protein
MMKTRMKLAWGAVICSAVAFSVTQGHAQVATNENDLLLCFQATSGNGSNLNLEVDLDCPRWHPE